MNQGIKVGVRKESFRFTLKSYMKRGMLQEAFELCAVSSLNDSEGELCPAQLAPSLKQLMFKIMKAGVTSLKYVLAFHRN